MRVLTIAIFFLVGLALAAFVATANWGTAAEQAGRKLYAYRDGYRSMTQRHAPVGRPLVVWMGDSTIMGINRPSYPQLLAPRLDREGRVASQVVAGAAFDFYYYYCLMDRVLEQADPDVIVIVLHLATFGIRRGSRFTYNDLCSMLPASELPHAFVLPMAARQMSGARLLLAKLLETDAGEETFYFAEGIRTLWADSPAWDVLGPKSPPTGIDWRFLLAALRAYDVPITRRTPLVRMMGATVRMATSRGRRVIVIGSPIPHLLMREGWWYNADVWGKRYAMLRSVVEDAGGTFIDLHEAIPTEEFADGGGHFNDKGALHMANLLEPMVLNAMPARDGNRSP